MSAAEVRSEERARNIIEPNGVPHIGFCHGCREMSPLLALKIMGLEPKIEVCQKCVEGWAARFGK